VNKFLITGILLMLPLFGNTAELIADKSVLAERDCFGRNFASYDTWRLFISNKLGKKIKNVNMRAKRLAAFDRKFTEVDFNRFKRRLSCRNFQYVVDGNNVKGFIIQPKNITEKLPVVIYNRGGNGNFGRVVFASMVRNLFPIAEQGFVIIGSQYRGTFNKNKDVDDEFGGQDVDDVMALFKLIPSIAGADENRIGMLGASRGGMQTYLALKQTEKVKAVAVIAGKSDAIVGLKQRPIMERVYKRRIPNYEQNKQAELEKRSVLKWLDEIPQDVPILLLHGMSDERVSVEQSITLTEALEKAGMPHKLVLYPGDNHGLVQNKVEATKEIVTWFNAHL
jgi:dipeptidyl aminopeptidase/acylaminoacyl peptidase